MKRILVAGDTHGDILHIKYLYEKAVFFEADVIIQLGDLGYWEHMSGGVQFLDEVSALAQQANIEFYWVDGNHENHQLLRYRYLGERNENWMTYEFERTLKWLNQSHPEPEIALNDEGFYKIRDGLCYIARGTRWNWHGVEMMGFGGAISVDVYRRRAGISWWPEEAIADYEVDAIVDTGKVDILFTHDLPREINIVELFRQMNMSYSVHQASDENRERLSKVIAATKPDYLYHGHMHHCYEDTIELDGHATVVRGLNCNSGDPTIARQSWTIVDLMGDGRYICV